MGISFFPSGTVARPDIAGMDTIPLWLTGTAPTFPPLDRDIAVDVLIIGAGVTGATAAYLLKQSGYDVALMDRDIVAGGETGHTTAHLTCATDLRLGKLVDEFGRDHAQAVWEAGQFAVDEIFRIVKSERIACELNRVPGYLFAADGSGESEIEGLHREAHLAAELGFDVDFLTQVPFAGRPGLRIANQAEFHPVQYVHGLAAVVDGGGSFVCQKSEVGSFEEEPRSAKVNGHTVRFKHCVIATHVPLQGRSSALVATLRQTKLAAYSTYAIGGPVPKDRYPRALFWDTAEPYHFVRFHSKGLDDYAIFGGADHKTGQADAMDAFARLRQTARVLVPDASFDRSWSGQVIESVDGLPYIGETTPGEFVATGFGGNGITFGTLAGIMARDWVLGVVNPWSDLFAVERKKLSAAWDYLRENKDYPHYLAKGALTPADTRDLNDVPRGSGRIVRLDGRKAAVHRRDDGSLSICSAVCPHLGCIVEWNGAEKTWDCPCHGSRFQATGEVFAGPAESPLAKRHK